MKYFRKLFPKMSVPVQVVPFKLLTGSQSDAFFSELDKIIYKIIDWTTLKVMYELNSWGKYLYLAETMHRVKFHEVRGRLFPRKFSE